MAVVIRKITPEDTYQLRHSVLRPHQSLEDCKYPLDFDEWSLHFGAFEADQLISVGSFYRERNGAFPDPLQYRLRGMATAPDHRGKGAGSKIMQMAIEGLAEIGAHILWCNARTTVSDFYKNLGMGEHGGIFDIHPIGPHKLMYQRLN